MNGPEPLTLAQLPTVIRICRRRRPFEDVGLVAETGLSPSTLRAAENGGSISLATLQSIINWSGESILITPQYAKGTTPAEKEGADEGGG